MPFEQSVFISRSGGKPGVTSGMAAIANTRFREDCDKKAGPFVQTAIPFEKLEDQFLELSTRHTAKHGFRTYDLLHDSAALLLRCDTFWSYDVKCAALAKLEGFKPSSEA